VFSSRVPSALAPNRLTSARARLERDGAPLIDLTESNPTRAGFHYPNTLLAPLSAPAGLVYDPQPFGLPWAREAVAGEYRRHGIEVESSRIVLTASTSEAYSLLFKLLCDPGDEVLVPAPSYPLVEHLTRLDAVRTVTYPLEYQGRWSADIEALERATTGHARAVIVVSPNNPTGSMLTHDELARLAAHCTARGLALIGDEVFADYVLTPPAGAAASILAQDDALTFALGGLSKAIGLPQLKLAWIAASGPAPLLDEALARLEIISDTYLSVSTPVQTALPELLAAGATVRQQIAARVEANDQALRALAASRTACDVLPVEGGWYAVVRVPAIQSEEALTLTLLERDHVVVHPGFFFDFPSEAFLVISLLPHPDRFARGVERVFARATGSVL
jgi:alanine-synthesizing transaminase